MNDEGGIPYRTLGRSGEKVSIIGLGGFHIGMPEDERESIRLVRMALENGINFLDNCWDYHNGLSEIRAGKALKNGYRGKAFVMSKVDGQTKEAVNEQLEESLRRLQVDHIDLLQFHEVIRPGDPERIIAAGGLQAMIDARQAGKIRYIGFTGHKDPDIHYNMIQTALKNGFTFDTVQMPLNVMDHHNEGFEKKVLPLALEHGIGVIGMKPLCNGLAIDSGVVSPIECLHYAMSLPTSVVITGCERMEILEQAIQAARTFRQMSPEELDELRSRTARVGDTIGYEPWKTTLDYDATNNNPAWLG